MSPSRDCCLACDCCTEGGVGWKRIRCIDFCNGRSSSSSSKASLALGTASARNSMSLDESARELELDFGRDRRVKKRPTPVGSRAISAGDVASATGVDRLSAPGDDVRTGATKAGTMGELEDEGADAGVISRGINSFGIAEEDDGVLWRSKLGRDDEDPEETMALGLPLTGGEAARRPKKERNPAATFFLTSGVGDSSIPERRQPAGTSSFSPSARDRTAASHAVEPLDAR